MGVIFQEVIIIVQDYVKRKLLEQVMYIDHCTSVHKLI